MRIGIMCHSSLGGSGRIGTGLAMELSRQGHRVHLFSRSKPFTGDDQRHQVVFHQVTGDRKEAWPRANFEVEWPAQESQALLAQVLKVVEQEGLPPQHEAEVVAHGKAVFQRPVEDAVLEEVLGAHDRQVERRLLARREGDREARGRGPLADFLSARRGAGRQEAREQDPRGPVHPPRSAAPCAQ
jgi:NAD(P)-dependent dehydrogenase (short-subunit alcohol dehydrogenase family)